MKDLVVLSSIQDLSDISGLSSSTETTPNPHLTVTTNTKEPKFQCKSYEIPLEFRCDGIPHCAPDNEDEKDCPEGKIQP